MWPAEAFNLARKTPKFVYFASFFGKTPFECVKTYHLWPLDMSKKNFWPAMRFELCTPGLDSRAVFFNLFEVEEPFKNFL